MKINYKLLNKKVDLLSGVLDAIEERDNNLYRIYFNAEPIPQDVRNAGFGGVNRYKNLEGFNNSVGQLHLSELISFNDDL